MLYRKQDKIVVGLVSYVLEITRVKIDTKSKTSRKILNFWEV
jgi:hypothetical protein